VRQLHVVAVTSDGKSLLLASAAKGTKATHRVAVDKRLHAALAGELYAEPADGEPERQELALTPREMQARLRAGASVEDVARAAGVPVDRVDRYFAPVESERNQVIDAAQTMVIDRPRWGPSARSMGDSVIANLAAVSGLKPETVAWSTRRRQDGCWIVRLDYTARSRRRIAEWEWEPHERAVMPLNHLAATMGYVEPRARARARATASRKAVGRKKTARKAPTRKTTRKATTRKTTARKATTKKAAARKTAARKTSARKTAGRKAATHKTTAHKATKGTTGGRRTTRPR
jgi:hypothetical protein